MKPTLTLISRLTLDAKRLTLRPASGVWRPALLVLFLVVGGCDNYDQEFYDGGQLKYTVRLKNGKKHGIAKKYYSSGEVEQISEWRDGIKNGKSTTFYKNGMKHVVSNWLNNFQEGMAYKYDSLGNLTSKMEYKNSVPHGSRIDYYPSGKIFAKEKYLKGVITDLAFSYYDNGKIKEIIHFNNGKRDYHKKFDSNGKILESFLPITASVTNDSVNIKLNYTTSKKPLIGIIYGRLDSKNQINDTVYMLSAEGIVIKHRIIPELMKMDTLTGILYEFELPEYNLMGMYPFKISN